MLTRTLVLAWLTVSALSSAGCSNSDVKATDAGVTDGATGADGGGGSLDDGGDAGADGGRVTCEPQRVEACRCGAGSAGTRECRPDGSHFGSCDCAVYGSEIFVDVGGSDAASGKAGAPKATLGGALAVVRGLVSSPGGLPAGGVVI